MMRSGWIVGLTLLAAGASFAAASDTGAGLDEATARGGGTLSSIRLGITGPRPLASPDWLLTTGDHPVLIHTCGLETLEMPDLALPAERPPRLPSLGGPIPALAPPLPSLRDAARPGDQEDTLRLLRSHW
jgi:hypothetical protein